VPASGGTELRAIIHFAASAYVGESVIDPGAYFRNNVCGTLSILEAMRDEGVPYIVVSGTCAVYGSPERMPITEDTPTDPINPYGASKLFMERMLADFEAAPRHPLDVAALFQRRGLRSGRRDRRMARSGNPPHSAGPHGRGRADSAVGDLRR
jgi:UDP-glucose 4-epimerase